MYRAETEQKDQWAVMVDQFEARHRESLLDLITMREICSTPAAGARLQDKISTPVKRAPVTALMIKPREIRNICLTAALCVVAPHLFAYIVGYWALLLAPAIRVAGVTSKLGLGLVIGITNALGALLAAAIMSVPFGWLLRDRVLVYGGIVGVVTTFVLFYWVYFFEPSSDHYWPPRSEPSAFGFGIQLIMYFSFIAGCMVFSTIGARLGRGQPA
jgi:hypothetical protein